VRHKSLTIKLLVSMVVSAGLGLAACASIDELKGTVSNWLSDATDRVPPEKLLSENATKASRRKDQQARKPQQLQTVEHPNKPLASVPAETPQRVDARLTPPQTPVQLDTPWPQAPSPGTFSR
jgi:hypothetical protein